MAAERETKERFQHFFLGSQGHPQLGLHRYNEDNANANNPFHVGMTIAMRVQPDGSSQGQSPAHH
jgi:hypothetical protein